MGTVSRILHFFSRVAFDPPKNKSERSLRVLTLVLLYLVGCAHWFGFLNWGDLGLTAHDWMKEDAYLNALRDAQAQGMLPWVWSENFYHGTTKLLAIPEIVMTPDILALRWLSNGEFVLLHVLLFYSLGFIGCLLLERKLKPSLVSFVFFWLLFNFSGYFKTHLAVGHFQWTGYFLLPFFFLLFFRFLSDGKESSSLSPGPVAAMSMLLGLLILNGSFHMAIWGCTFMIVALLWRLNMAANIAVSIIFGLMLGLGRLLPAALFFPAKDPFLSGYPSLNTLLEGLTSLRGHNFPWSGAGLGVLGWWEYDIYIGFVGSLLLVFAVVMALRESSFRVQAPAWAAGAVFLLFSLGNVYAFVAKSSIPFSGVERISSRFVIMPFLLAMMASMRGLDCIFRRWPRTGKMAVLALIPFLVGELGTHSSYWDVGYVESTFPIKTKPVLAVLPQSDSAYAFSVYGGWAVSTITFMILIGLVIHARRSQSNT